MNERTEYSVLGEVVGTATGWDCLDQWTLMLHDFQPNAAGRQFVPDFPDGADLCVDFDRGTVSAYDDEGKETNYKADWSVFNQE